MLNTEPFNSWDLIVTNLFDSVSFLKTKVTERPAFIGCIITPGLFVIYVGKAKNLKNAFPVIFRKKVDGEKNTLALVSNIDKSMSL